MRDCAGLWLFFLAVGCAAPPSAGHRELVVFAASSLTDAFTEVATDFEEAHPGVSVRLTFGGSQTLRLQIEQGAPADLFASADIAHIAALRDTGHLRRSRTFAANVLAVIVPTERAGPGRSIDTFQELDRAQRLVVGSDGVPLGRYTRELFTAAGATLGGDFEVALRQRIVSREGNARLVRAKVELGEADAAVVYRSDASSSTRVREVTIPPEMNVRATYGIAALSRTAASPLAADFIAHLGSPAGRRTLRDHGLLDEPR